MSDVRKLTVPELRSLVTDPSELAKGTEVADRGGLSHVARHANKLFADAAGSGASPYKVQIVFAEDKVTGRCSCMAARSRPFCKHAAALLVSWARSPEAFVVSESPPVALEGGPARRATVKKGNVDPAVLRKKGVDQASTLLAELWQSGVTALGEDRAPQVAELATSLRELGLRRLSGRTLELSSLLARAARRDGSMDVEDYASSIADMWLTVRKLEKHLGGEPLQDEHVEELIGRTWTKKDRKPIAGLDLFEYAFLQRTTADDFLLRESRLFDLASGEHYSEKQILPAVIAKRVPAKPSYRGQRLSGAEGTLFPSFAPRRLNLENPGEKAQLTTDALERALSAAVPDVSRALSSLAERRRDVFAPPSIPVLLRIDRVVPFRDRVRFVDASGAALFLSGGRDQENALMTALTGTTALAVFGDVALEGALPSLFPLAVVARDEKGLCVVPLGGDDAGTAAEERSGGSTGWKAAAKSAGVPLSATMLGEVRDDLAAGFVEGWAACRSPRFVDPLVARLAELKLDKQGEALRTVATANDPATALDSIVKVYQVLGIALSRLAGTAPIDRATLVSIPSMPSVAVPRSAKALTPDAAVASEARGEIHRYERAYHVGVHFQSMDPAALLRDVHTWWGNGFAAPFVVRAAAADGELALRGALSALAVGRNNAWGPSPCRLAKLTAIQVLAASPDSSAKQVLRDLSPRDNDAALLAHARRAVDGPQLSGEILERHLSMVIAGTSKDHRIAAIEALVASAAVEGIPVLRAALRDRTAGVRKAAAYALAALGDTLSLDTFVTWLEGEDHERAKIGAHAIGALGDVRGGSAVLGALARGFSPVIVRETLQLLGPWVLGPLLDLGEAQPELLKRATVSSLVKTFEKDHAVRTLAAWIAAAGDPAHRVRRAQLGFEVASGRKDVAHDLSGWLAENHGEMLTAEDKDVRALRKKMEKAR
jgi:HEAT repeat protein